MHVRPVEPVPVGPGPEALLLLPRLREALAGRGPALLPHAAGSPPAADHAACPVEPDTAVVLATSGSTGSPRYVRLSADCLLTSARATHDRLGGPGRWTLVLPPYHVAGLQVLVRSLLAGVQPVVADPSSRTLGGDRTAYISVVPTQLRRLGEQLAGFGAVLVGGAAADEALLARARGLGVRVVTTYGMTETAGGCVYDGVPLDGTTVGLLDGVVELAGPTVAQGYLGGADFDGRFRTSDLGRLDAGGRLVVDGRADDVIVTGGLNVAPARVENALRQVLQDVEEVLVLGIPDPQWGQAVAVVLLADQDVPVGVLRQRLRGVIADHELPRATVSVRAIPALPSGKPDRVAARDLFATRAPYDQ